MVAKSANWNSMTGRKPSIAAPMAMPAMASSLIGALITRLGYFSPSPWVTLKAPPNGAAMSWP